MNLVGKLARKCMNHVIPWSMDTIVVNLHTSENYVLPQCLYFSVVAFVTCIHTNRSTNLAMEHHQPWEIQQWKETFLIVNHKLLSWLNCWILLVTYSLTVWNNMDLPLTANICQLILDFSLPESTKGQPAPEIFTCVVGDICLWRMCYMHADSVAMFHSIFNMLGTPVYIIYMIHNHSSNPQAKSSFHF